jgi:hypothetical protein
VRQRALGSLRRTDWAEDHRQALAGPGTEVALSLGRTGSGPPVNGFGTNVRSTSDGAVGAERAEEDSAGVIAEEGSYTKVAPWRVPGVYHGILAAAEGTSDSCTLARRIQRRT